jgi:hypothetical protein
LKLLFLSLFYLFSKVIFFRQHPYKFPFADQWKTNNCIKIYPSNTLRKLQEIIVEMGKASLWRLRMVVKIKTKNPRKHVEEHALLSDGLLECQLEMP